MSDPVVDSHQHFWDPTRADYPWLTDELARIRRPFGPSDLEPLLRTRGVDCTIVVQTRSSVDETVDLLALAAQHSFIAGVVGWIDLTAASASAALDELRQAPGGAKLIGIRHQVHDEVDPGWLLRDDVQTGIAAVGRACLTYDLLVRPRELPAAVETARRHPEVRFVVDHLAKPRVRQGEDPEWADGLARLAEHENVACKLSGLVTEARWNSWRVEDLAPFVHHALACFGVRRLLFGSDWPVCLLAGDYPQVFDAYRDALGVSDDVCARVFGLNAIDVYRLPSPGETSRAPFST
jgi:L-fucono-1,5-lactonase